MENKSYIVNTFEPSADSRQDYDEVRSYLDKLVLRISENFTELSKKRINSKKMQDIDTTMEKGPPGIIFAIYKYLEYIR